MTLKRAALIICLVLVPSLLGLTAYLHWEEMAPTLRAWYGLIKEPEAFREVLIGWGPIGAPVLFIGLQIAQVILAPVPGEASGFVGGYLFGTLPGFVYSTIGLTIGSIINFTLGRVLGRRYVCKWVPGRHLEKFDRITRRKGVLIFFLFFVFPGFPKDYLCIFLGLSTLPARLFVPMATIGRIPGTLMLSLQGAQVFEKDYLTLAVLIALTLALVIPAYLWRERIYTWTEKIAASAGHS